MPPDLSTLRLILGFFRLPAPEKLSFDSRQTSGWFCLTAIFQIGDTRDGEVDHTNFADANMSQANRSCMMEQASQSVH